MSNQTVVVCQCGQKIRATERLVGKTVRCPKCQQPVKIPADQATASVKKKSPGDKIRAQCEACGTKLAVKPELAGKRVQCPKCKQPVKIPTTNKGEGPPPVKTTPPKSPSSQPPPGKPKKGAKSAAKATGVADLLDEVGVTETLGNCPECRTELEADQRICLSCGFDQDRGKRVNVKKFLDDDSKYNPYAKVKGGPNAKTVELHPKVSSTHKMMQWLAIWYIFLAVMTAAGPFILPLISEEEIPTNDFSTTLGLGIFGGLAFACIYAAGLFKQGRRKSRPMCIAIAILSLLFGFPCGTIIAIFVLIWAMSYEVTEHCR